MEETYNLDMDNLDMDKVACISNFIKESKMILEMETKYPNMLFT